MAQRTDNESGTSFLTNTPNVDNSWLYRQKTPTNPNYSVLAEYYARQAAKANQAHQMPKFTQRQTYNVTQPPPMKVPTPSNLPVIGPPQPAPKLPVAPVQQRATFAPSWNFGDWYRGTMNRGLQATGFLPQNVNPLTSTPNVTYSGQNRAMQYLNTIGNNNPLYSLPGPVGVNTTSRIYKGNKVPIGMQRYEEIASGRASPEMLLYGSANRWTEHLPPPPTSDGGSGSGSGGGGYYTGYPSYSGGGGGGGYGSYTPQPSRWWTDNAIWRI